MKFSFAGTAGFFLGLFFFANDSAAFAPSKIPTTARATDSAIYAAANDDDNVDKKEFALTEVVNKVIPSFLVASALALSVSTVDLPTGTGAPAFVEPANAAFFQKTADPPAVADTKGKKVAAKPAAASDTSKIVSSEEKELIKAKSNLNSSKDALKAYEKLTSDAKAANGKAVSALESATKNADNAKKEFVAASDKLSAAKKQKMPQSAITELSALSAKLKEVSNGKDKILNDASKTASKTKKDVEKGEKGIKDSQKAVKKAEKNVKKAEKEFKKYNKKVKKELKKQEEKIKALEKQAKKLKSLKEKETKELSGKEKDLQSEFDNLKQLKRL